jgi:hypothetical protein
MEKKQKPITRKDEIRQNPDPKIDQDFKGYPDGPATDETIHPENRAEEKIAGLNKKDGEKQVITPQERKPLDEQDSNGSANAFEGK